MPHQIPMTHKMRIKNLQKRIEKLQNGDSPKTNISVRISRLRELIRKIQADLDAMTIEEKEENHRMAQRGLDRVQSRIDEIDALEAPGPYHQARRLRLLAVRDKISASIEKEKGL